MTMHEFLPGHPVHHNYYRSAPKTSPTVRKVYEGNNTSDNSDYGELRAIVKRIEMNSSQTQIHDGKKSDLGNQERDNKLVFDYIPASVMMKR